jgi:hypothetical protein
VQTSEAIRLSSAPARSDHPACQSFAASPAHQSRSRRPSSPYVRVRAKCDWQPVSAANQRHFWRSQTKERSFLRAEHDPAPLEAFATPNAHVYWLRGISSYLTAQRVPWSLRRPRVDLANMCGCCGNWSWMFRRGILEGGARESQGPPRALLVAGDRRPSQYCKCIKFRG